jgi:ribonucleoside-diphosphate reductase beta chain
MAIFETEPDVIDMIFDEWRNNDLLKKRNIMIADIYQRFINDKTVENFVRACMGNYNLESIFFWSGFTFFNLLAKQGEMLQTNQMIQYIKKDEQTHVVLFANILNELQKEYPEVFTPEFKEELRSMMKLAVEWEIEWGCTIMNDEIEGINNTVIEKYIKWLSNERLKRIGLIPLYPEIVKHPMLWIEEFNDFNNIKEDIFENGALTNYQQPTEDQGWDELFE